MRKEFGSQQKGNCISRVRVKQWIQVRQYVRHPTGGASRIVAFLREKCLSRRDFTVLRNRVEDVGGCFLDMLQAFGQEL